MRLWWKKRPKQPSVAHVYSAIGEMIEIWRSHGIVCCQVAPGNF
jgi:hypothetical protein